MHPLHVPTPLAVENNGHSPDGDELLAERATSPGGLALRFVTFEEFANATEDTAGALLGDAGAAIIPEGGDVMVYGDGGAGKTTLVIDLACHLAAGDDWLGIHVSRPVRVAMIENEGPRPFLRAKLERKLNAWPGSPINDRATMLEAPWATLTLGDERHRDALAAAIRDMELDVVVIGPVTRAGMNEAGTLQETRDFSLLLGDVRRRSGRPIAFVLIHHENKTGAVSGAWEGAGDTLLHVQGQGHGHTRLHVQKARWASDYHAKTLKLAWTPGEGFQVSDEPDRSDDAIADEILEAVRANGGASWNTVDKTVAGKGDRLRAIRDRLLKGGHLVDAGGRSGMSLWHADDPDRPEPQEPLRTDRDAPGTHLRPTPGSHTSDGHCVPASPLLRDAGRRDAVGSPAAEDEKTVDARPPQ